MSTRNKILCVVVLLPGLVLADSSQRGDQLNASAGQRLLAGDCKTAMEEAEQALQAYGHAATTTQRATALTNVGVAATYCGDYTRAASALETATKLTRDTAEPEALVKQITNLINVYFYLGNYGRALQGYDQALNIINRAGAQAWVPRRRALLTVNIAALRQRLGQDEEALSLYRTALSDTSVLKVNENAQLHVNLGVLYRRLGDPHKALREYDVAAQMFRNDRHTDGELGALKNRGIVYALDLGELKLAQRTFLQAHDLAEKAGIRREAMQARLYRGEALYRSGDYDGATADFSEALSDSRTLNTAEEKWKALFGLARVAIRRGDPAAAGAPLKEAIQVIESLREKVQIASVRRDFFANKREVYDALIAVTLPHGDARTLFELIERSKARSFQDHLQQGTGVPSLEQIRAQLPPETVLLTYWQSRRGNAVVWVTHEGAGVKKLPALPPGFTLTPELLPDNALGARNLLIVPDGLLNGRPFETIRTGNSWLVEHTAVTYLPSSALLLRKRADRGWLPAPPWARELAAFGDPDVTSGDLDPSVSRLPESRVEVESIAHVLPGRAELHLGRDNLRAAFVNERAPVIHVATHAYADSARPERSRLLFSSGRPDKAADYLFLNELLALDFTRTELITISACDTERGADIEGEGVENFSRALLGAGAGATITTLWRIEDKAAAVFMTALYRHLARGETRAQALQQTKVEFIRSGTRMADPGVWAAFVLSGDGNTPLRVPVSGTASLVTMSLALALPIAVISAVRHRRQKSTGNC